MNTLNMNEDNLLNLNYFTPLRISNAQSASPCSFITAPEVGVLNVQRCNKPVYYLISQNFYGCEVYDILNKNDCLSGIHKKTEIIKIDTEDIDNLFEIIKEEEEEKLYKIIHIIKQHKNVFEVGDLIYLDFGMISFYTKTINGKIDKTEILQTGIIEKEKILLYNSLIDIKMRALLDVMNENYTKNEDYEKVKNCINSILYQ